MRRPAGERRILYAMLGPRQLLPVQPGCDFVTARDFARCWMVITHVCRPVTPAVGYAAFSDGREWKSRLCSLSRRMGSHRGVVEYRCLGWIRDVSRWRIRIWRWIDPARRSGRKRRSYRDGLKEMCHRFLQIVGTKRPVHEDLRYQLHRRKRPAAAILTRGQLQAGLVNNLKDGMV